MRPLLFLVGVVALAVLPLSQAYNGTLVLEVLPLISLTVLHHMPACACLFLTLAPITPAPRPRAAAT